MAKYIFWLSFLSGFGSLIGLPYQSLNIAIIPGLTYLILNMKFLSKLPVDCALLMLSNAVLACISLYFLSTDSILSLFQFLSVVVVYVSLRCSKYYPSSRGIFNFILINLSIGFFQSFSELGFRGVDMLESEPSRSARSLSVLVFPIAVDWKSFKNFVPPVSLALAFFIFLNRSASLILPALFAFGIILLYIFKSIRSWFTGLIYLKKKILGILLSLFALLQLLLIFASETRAVKALIVFINELSNFSGLETLNIIFQLTGRRIQSVLQVYSLGIFSLPRGLQGYNDLLSKESLQSSIFTMTEYHYKKLSATGNFEPFSYAAALTAQGGLLSFSLILIFTIYVIVRFAIIKRPHIVMHLNESRLEYYACISAIFLAIFQVWFYSTDSILQPWVLLAISLNFVESNLFKSQNFKTII